MSSGGFVAVTPGVDLYVQDVGNGPPVVLLAGFGLDHGVWDRQVCTLGAEHRVLCIDLRGTGRSSKPYDEYGLDRLAADVASVLEQLDIRHAALVGWSFGGQVAFRVAAENRDRAARLVLVASAGVRASRSREFPFGPVAEQLERKLVGAELEDRIAARVTTIRSGFHREPADHTVDFLVRTSLRMPSWAAVASYRSYLHSDSTALIDAVHVPVSQIVGGDDRLHSADGAQWLCDRLSDSRLQVLPDCGHYPMFEAPEAFDAALQAFVSGEL
jgi:pimeloyl-ACP methyl ester carboxylesterase